jgi:outer membrane protein assembly factor BamB
LQWGLTGSPLIVNDLVVVHAGIDPEKPIDAALVAYDFKTGRERWAHGKRKAGYASPQLATLAGMPQILMFDGEALAGIDPSDGRELWMYPWPTKFQQNCSQPVVLGTDRVFISSEAENGCAMLRIEAPSTGGGAWSVKPAWENKKLGARFSNPVSDGTHLFGLHNIRGFLKCLDVKTGKLAWSGEDYEPGQMLLIDDVILLMDGNGEMALLQIDAAEPKVLAKYRVFDAKTWNTPAIAGDQLFVRNQFEIACFQLPRR